MTHQPNEVPGGVGDPPSSDYLEYIVGLATPFAARGDTIFVGALIEGNICFGISAEWGTFFPAMNTLLSKTPPDLIICLVCRRGRRSPSSTHLVYWNDETKKAGPIALMQSQPHVVQQFFSSSLELLRLYFLTLDIKPPVWYTPENSRN